MISGHRTRNAFLVGVLALVAVAAAGWFFLLSPRLAQADEIALQAEDMQMSNVQAQNRYNQTLTQAESATDAASEAQALFSTMPEEADLPSVLSQISTAATSAGIKESDISLISTSVPKSLMTTTKKPSENANDTGEQGVSLAQMDLNLTVNGTRPQLLEFLTNLQSLDRAVLVQSSELASTVVSQPGEDRKELNTLKLQASMFVLQSKLPDLVAHVQELLAEAQNGNLKPTA